MNQQSRKLPSGKFGEISMKVGIWVVINLMAVFSLAGANDSPKEHVTVSWDGQQQTQTIRGTVADENGEPIIGANVSVKGTTKGTITDVNGEFAIENIDANTVLLITYIGYLPQEVEVDNRTFLNIVIKEDTQKLDEVVVIGYGTMKKKDLTGAVSSVKMDDSPVSTISTISHALAGKAAGLQIRTTSAQPGGESTFRIRGAASVSAGNDPLIVIDGFPVNSVSGIEAGKYSDGSKDNILGSINPNDIESIEVLKDASSTAIYGARAGNGVIIVTTKKGQKGDAKVRYSGSVSVQQIGRSYDMMNAEMFMRETNRYLKEDWMSVNQIGIYGGRNEAEVTAFVPRYSDSEISNPPYRTNWFDEITRTGFQNQHNVSITGGTDKTKYMISGNFFQQDGVLKNNQLERFTGRINIEQKLSKYVNMGVNLTLSQNKYDNVPLGNKQSENASIMVSAAQFNPIMPIKDEEGNYTINPRATFLPNPVSLLEITDVTNKQRVLGTAFIEIQPVKDLILKGNFGVDRNYQKRKVYLPTTTLYGQREGGKADIGQADNTDYLMELTANYTKGINDHRFNILGGYSFQSFNSEGLGASNNQFLIDGFLFNNLGAGAAAKPGVSSSASKSEMASFFGRINYTYKDRYLLTATMRADGASNFAKNNRWGYFPSVALGWRFTEENFMKPVTNVLSNGKLRVSYGSTGNSNIGNRAISYYQVDNNNEFGDTEYKGVYLKQMGNPDMKWETTWEWNIGLDLGFFDNRLNVTAEYFDKVVSDLLSERNLLSYHEIEKIAANIGKTQSRGFELTLNSRNVNTKDFSWNTDFTFSLYKDKWNERDVTWKPAAYDIYKAPLRGDYGYLSDGLVGTGETLPHMPGALPGQVKIKDIDGFVYNDDGSIQVDKNGRQLKTGVPDGKLDDADKVFYGSWDPGFAIGFNNMVQWKNFDLNVYFYGQFNTLYSGSYKENLLLGSQGVANLNNGYNMPSSIRNVWSSDNPAGTYPGYFQRNSTWGVGDYFHQKVWYVRCRNITLGYNVPMNKKILSNLRVYVDVNNPFVLTNYNGLDPETDTNFYAYPNVRSYSLGLDITF